MGDCYFLAIVVSFAEKPGRVRAMFHNKIRNNAGCYLLKFFIDGVPTGVMIDDNFLTKDDHLLFA